MERPDRYVPQMDPARRQRELFTLLSELRPLWTGRPFADENLRWTTRYPELSAWLLSLSPEQVDRLDADLSLVAAEAPTPLCGWAERVGRLCALDRVEAGPTPGLGPKLCWEMPGRKRGQVAAFAAAVAARVPAGLEVVDWCAGKGYLGRALAGLYRREVMCVETRGALCRRGEALDRRAEVSCTWRHADIHGASARRLLGGRAVVALHACGELHRELVVRAVQHQAAALAFAPCCYHRRLPEARPTPSAARMADDHNGPIPPPPVAPPYAPLSTVTRGLDLELDHHALLLPTSEQVVARPREIRARRDEQRFRLALDHLIRQATGRDRYHPVPPLPAAWLRLPFLPFLERVNRAFGLELSCPDPDALLSRADQRLKRATALGLVRGLFRRPLELYLALDCVLYLQESGRNVSVQTFCKKNVTPRNLFIFSGI